MRLLIFGMIWGVIAISCRQEPTGKNPNPPQISMQKASLWDLVTDIGINVISPAFNKLERDTRALGDTIFKQCQNISQWDRKQLKQSFLSAMRSYHLTEVFQIGPTARNGYELREQMYSWPRSNSYLIDTEVAKKQKKSDYQYKGLGTSMGFPALEYLIYEETLTNQCHNCGMVLLEDWNQLPRDKKMVSRCDYMKFVSTSLTRNAQKLREAWNPVNGDITLSPAYRQDFKTLKEFAVKLTHGLIFLDREVKDHRLGTPSGIHRDLCSFDSCPEQSEHWLSKDSIYSLLYTTKGFFSVFTGDRIDGEKPGYGFEEWLLAKGHHELVKEFKKRTLNFIQNLEKLKNQTHLELLAQDVVYEKCRATTTENRMVEICALYKDLKQITDLYKTDFLLATNFGRPHNQGGDTD